MKLFLPVLLLVLLSGAAWPQNSGAELILRSYQHSYPDKAEEVSFIDGDWTIKTGDRLFYWAEGRLLPASERSRKEAFTPHPFDVYPQTVPPPEIYSSQYIESLRAQGGEEARMGPDQCWDFQALLYGGIARTAIEAQLARMNFLGKNINVHKNIVVPLRRAEAAILAAAEKDSETTAFVSAIGQIGAYNWRDIRGTRRMSYHSWGLAVDIQPVDAKGKAIYWLWERTRNENWMLIPLERRWAPPAAVIQAFENEGFIWGGKWALFDNMHFEYRPELHEINRLLAAQSAETPAVVSSAVQTRQDLHHIYPAITSPGLLQRLRKGLPVRPAK
jgi:hypothetical protein